MLGHEERSWSVWCQEEVIEKEEKSTKTLLHQVTTGVTALAQQARRLKETKA